MVLFNGISIIIYTQVLIHSKGYVMIINLKKLLPLLLIFLSFFSLTPINAAEIPSDMQYQDTKLILNGHGTRTMFFAKIYESGLYLESANTNAEEIISQDSVMGIRLEVISSMLTSEKMKNALNEALIKSTNDNTQPIVSQISQLMATINDVEVGDVYEFIYLPESGIDVIKNTKHLDTVAGLDFKKAFFGIWISNNPVQKSLKKAMLGN